MYQCWPIMKLRGRPPVDEGQVTPKKPVMIHEDNVSRERNHRKSQQSSPEISKLHTNLTDEQLQDITLQKGGRLVWKSPVIVMERVNLRPPTYRESESAQVKLASRNEKDLTNIKYQPRTKDEPLHDGPTSVLNCQENSQQNSQKDEDIAMETECVQNAGLETVQDSSPPVASKLLHQNDTCIPSAQDPVSDTKPSPCILENQVVREESLILRTEDSSKVVVMQFGSKMIDNHHDAPPERTLTSPDHCNDQSVKMKPQEPEIPTLLRVPGRSETFDECSTGDESQREEYRHLRPRNLFEIDFDDECLQESDSDDDLPEVAIRGKNFSKRKKLPTEDDLPDLLESPRAKKQCLLQNLEEGSLEVGIFESLNSSLDSPDWIQTSGDLQQEWKTRLRKGDNPNIERSENLVAILEDGTFNEAYKKHGASLKKLVKDKIKEEKIAEMEASLLADLERGGFRKILEEKEEGEDEELMEDEKTKKAWDLIRKDWGTLPYFMPNSAIFEDERLNFCHHTLSLDKYFSHDELKTLSNGIRKIVESCTVGNEHSIQLLIKTRAARSQTFKWCLDMILCHPKWKIVLGIVTSVLGHLKEVPIDLKTLKFVLHNAGIARHALNMEGSDQEPSVTRSLCPLCRTNPPRKQPAVAASLLRVASKLLQISKKLPESHGCFSRHVVLLLLASQDTKLSQNSAQLLDNVSNFINDLEDWEVMKLEISEKLLQASLKLNILVEIVQFLEYLSNRGQELARMISISALKRLVLYQDVLSDFNLERLLEIVKNFKPESFKTCQLENADELKNSFYCTSVTLPLIRICIGNKCPDERNVETLERIWARLRVTTRKIRDDGIIYKSQIKYELSVVMKHLRQIIRNAPKSQDCSIFKYLRSGPVTAEIVNASSDDLECLPVNPLEEVPVDRHIP